MAVRIFTIPFDPGIAGFPDDELRKFLVNKKLSALHPHFFQRHGMPYWTIFVEYEPVVSKDSDDNEGFSAGATD